jgi:ABC-type multidrug transport system ATPase subunit
MSLLEFRGVGFEDGEHAALRGLDFSVEAGRRLFVFGRSGSGKGTVMRLAAGVLEPGAGTVRLEAGERCLAPVGYVPREGGMLSNLSLLDNAVLPVVYHKMMSRDAASRKARSWFDEFGIGSQALKRPAEVGVSVRRLALLARGILAEPPLFVLEDPLSEVDAAAARVIKSVLERISQEGRACLLAAGSLSPFEGWEGSFLFLRGGKAQFYEDGRALSAEKDPEVRACLG